MTERAVREMIADWLGAGRAYEGRFPDINDWKWFDKNWEKIKNRLHSKSIQFVEKIIKEIK